MHGLVAKSVKVNLVNPVDKVNLVNFYTFRKKNIGFES